MQFIDRKICMTKIDGVILCVIIFTFYKNTAYFDNMRRYGTKCTSEHQTNLGK